MFIQIWMFGYRFRQIDFDSTTGGKSQKALRV